MTCPKCNKNPAIKHDIYGVLPCNECTEKSRTGRQKMGKWMSNQYLEKYASTPFWKHMGLPPKKHEIKQEKEMKRRGLSYADLQRARNSGKNARFNNSELIKKALKGELPRGKQVTGTI